MKKRRSKVFAIIMVMMMLIGSVSFSYATQESSDSNAGNSTSNEQNVNNGSAKSDNDTAKQGESSNDGNQAAQESEGTSDQSKNTDSDTNLSSLDSDSEDNAEATAYAVFDSSTGTLTFKKGSDIPEATDTTKVFTGVEDTSKSIPWEGIVDDVIKVVFQDTISPKTTSGWFIGMNNLKTVENLKRLDLSKCTDMSFMFSGCSSLTSIDLSGIDASKATDISDMFSYCDSLKSVNLKGLDISNATNLESMFEDCNSLESIGFSEVNASSVKNVTWICEDCYELTTVIMPSCAPTSMDDMFNKCYALGTIDLSNLDCSGATSYSGAFSNTSIHEAKLGESFSFGKSELPSSGLWYKEGSDKRYTASELAKEYDGATMAGTYLVDCDESVYITSDYLPLDGADHASANVRDAKTSLRVGYAYCTNRKVGFSSKQHVKKGYEVSNNDEYLKWLDPNTEANRDSSINLYEAISTVLYYGFGSVNASLTNEDKSLQEACEIDDEAAVGITQDAIWYYSDGIESSSDYDGNEKEYYLALTGRSSEYNLTYDSIPNAAKFKLEVLSEDGKVGTSQNLVMLTFSQKIDGNITDDANKDTTDDSNKDSSGDTIKTDTDSNGTITNDSTKDSSTDTIKIVTNSNGINDSNNSSTSDSDSVANTGDNTPIGILFGLMGIAALGGVFVALGKRRKEQK